MSEVAFASGFASLRRFNDAFSRSYGIPPTRFRRAADDVAREPAPNDVLVLQLAYRPPFDWTGLLAFLRARTLRGVEHVTDDAYRRTVRLGDTAGWIAVRDHPDRRALTVELTHSLTPVLPALLGRLRHLFDLSARPDVITEHLASDPALAAAVRRNPGLRVPGAFDGFELGVRAILGQQVTVKAATTLAGRFVDAFGESLATPDAELTRLSPTPVRIASASIDDVASLGIIQARARSIVALADAIASGRLTLEPGADPEQAIAHFVALPGVGPWTAHYVAMRALRWPDAFPREDIVLRQRLGGVTPRRAEEISRRWRPWRSYATLHLWRSAADAPRRAD
jgi:AraC family transcriptional regulator of adaptative response / DNA-3-methyladenine glycosylase II